MTIHSSSLLPLDKIENNTASKRRVFISLPKKYMAGLAQHYELVTNFSLFIYKKLHEFFPLHLP